ncbi:hypothetical protein L484_021441 [Morus notabilis]|uniref:Uncharacterized protein n=1 Tax=Morus notabilis TaxID=981085 RepID=W9RXK0_9ROSA|nr:hypothetical protein L484_021441 [Morus notabilis]
MQDFCKFPVRFLSGKGDKWPYFGSIGEIDTECGASVDCHNHPFTLSISHQLEKRSPPWVWLLRYEEVSTGKKRKLSKEKRGEKGKAGDLQTHARKAEDSLAKREMVSRVGGGHYSGKQKRMETLCKYCALI